MSRNASTLSRWSALLPGLAAIVATLLLLAPEFSLLDGYDWLRMHIFYKEHYREVLLEGRLPWWNPYVGLGRPFLADVETATLYPPNLFYLAGIGPGLAATLLFHFGLMIWGTLRLARRLGCRESAAWFAALGFALGAPVIGRLQSGQAQVFCTLCWLPLLFDAGRALLDRPGGRSAATLAAIVAAMFLAGSPPMFWLAGWALGLWLAVQLALRRGVGGGRTLGWLGAAGALAAGLAAVQLLPFLELIREGNRSIGNPAFALTHTQEAARWLSVFQTRPPVEFYYWEYNLYSGLLLTGLAALALARWRDRETAALLVVVLVFAVLAAGPALGLLRLLVELVPGWAAFRYPSRYAIITMFGAALLAALTIEALLRWAELRRPALAAAGRFAAWAVLGLNAADNMRAWNERAAAYSHQSPTLQESELAALLAAPGIGDGNGVPPRVLATPWIIRENSGLRHGYSTLSSFANPGLARVWDHLHAVADTRPDIFDRTNLPMSVYAVSPGRNRELGLQARWDESAASWRIDPAPEPRAYLATAARTVTDWRTANRLIAAGHPFREIALVENPAIPGTAATRADPAPGTTQPARITRFEAERIEVTVESTVPGILVLAEPWYPGWTATIAGRAASLQPVNGWMRGVPVPAGRHEVVLRYHSQYFALGALVTALAVGIACLLWIRHSSRPRFPSRQFPS